MLRAWDSVGSSSVVQQDEEVCVGSEATLSELEEQQPASYVFSSKHDRHSDSQEVQGPHVCC